MKSSIKSHPDSLSFALVIYRSWKNIFVVFV